MKKKILIIYDDEKDETKLKFNDSFDLTEIMDIRNDVSEILAYEYKNYRDKNEKRKI